MQKYVFLPLVVRQNSFSNNNFARKLARKISNQKLLSNVTEKISTEIFSEAEKYFKENLKII